jgi:hypothetical protein
MSEVKKYTKKPVTIEAILWTGHNLREVIAFTGLHPSAEKWSWEEYCEVVRTEGLKIFTLEGPLLARIEDYIIKGVNGEFYPCKPDIFEKTYTPGMGSDELTTLLAVRQERDRIKRHMTSLMCAVNAVTAPYRHGQPVPRMRLEMLSSRQIAIESALAAVKPETCHWKQVDSGIGKEAPWTKYKIGCTTNQYISLEECYKYCHHCGKPIEQKEV